MAEISAIESRNFEMNSPSADRILEEPGLPRSGAGSETVQVDKSHNRFILRGMMARSGIGSWGWRVLSHPRCGGATVMVQSKSRRERVCRRDAVSAVPGRSCWQAGNTVN